jgi:ubiquitin carboxyl-terminal hydrolase 34
MGGLVDGALLHIAQCLRSVADESWISARGWDDFYLTLCQLSQMGSIETAVLLNHEFLEFCLKILAMHIQPHLRASEPDIWRLVERKKPIFNRLIEFVYTLLSKVDIRLPVPGSCAQAIDRWAFYDRALSKFPLSQSELNTLLLWDDNNKCIAILDRMFELFDSAKTDVFYPGEVVKWMLWAEDGPLQRRLYYTVREGVACLTSPLQDPYIRSAISYCEATPELAYVDPIVDAVSKNATELREGGGEMHLQFFNALLSLKNDRILDRTVPDHFFDLALSRSRQYVIPLLFHDDDAVRKDTFHHCDDLFRKLRPDGTLGQDSLKFKYSSIRRLLREMYRRIVIEHQNGSSRSFMTPLINTCQMLVEVLFAMMQNEDMADYRDGNEGDLITEYQMNVEERVRHWLPDDGTPISAGGKFDAHYDACIVDAVADSSLEAYEHSDYESESDEGPDLES